MGDAADWILDQIDFDGGSDFDESLANYPAEITCRYCGREHLTWGMRDGKWRLFDRRGIHVCPVFNSSEPEFQ